MFAKVKYLLAIGLLFLIPACATGQATGASAVDIDATVEARLAIIPTPTPQIITQEVEVIVEKEVPIETEVIKEVIVEKEVVIEVPKEVEVIKEVVVEKIVEKEVQVPYLVVVTATPTPKPTATPTPLPIPTATPIPVPTDKSSDFVVVTKSQGETKLVNRYKDVTMNIQQYPHYWKKSTQFIDRLITNTHPNLPVKAYYHVKVIDSEGYFVMNKLSDDNPACIYPNTTKRVRYEDVTEDSGGNKITIDVITRFEHEKLNNFILYPERLCEKVEIIDIDESLLDEVEIDITEKDFPWNFDIDVKNNSDSNIIWKGRYTVKDEYGYVLYERILESYKIEPNFREEVVASWDGKTSNQGIDPFYLRTEELFFVNKMCEDKVCEGVAFTTDLENFEATLRTIQLIKAD